MLRGLNICRFVIGAACSTRLVHTTSIMKLPEPPKKRAKIDPAVLQNKFLKKKRLLEKEIRQLLRITNKPKPVEELTLDFQIVKQIKKHQRKSVPISDEEKERRALLEKEWTRFQFQRYKLEMRRMNAMVRAQEHALQELRIESEELYQAAIQPSTSLLPFVHRGPTQTPPIPNYAPPDGDYIDTTKTYEL